MRVALGILEYVAAREHVQGALGGGETREGIQRKVKSMFKGLGSVAQIQKRFAPTLEARLPAGPAGPGKSRARG